MYNNSRRMEIIRYIQKREMVTNEELCEALFASPSTVRRYLKQLEMEGYLRRTHGGALVIKQQGSDAIPFNYRWQNNSGSKAKIAERAVKEIKNGDCIFLDASTTAANMVAHLGSFLDLIVVTNGLFTAMELENLHKFQVYSTGGRLKNNYRSYMGPFAERMIRHFRFDEIFISMGGVSQDLGVYDQDVDHVSMCKCAFSCSKRRILLADSSKFDCQPPYRLCSLSDFDLLITDKKIEVEKEQEDRLCIVT